MDGKMFNETTILQDKLSFYNSFQWTIIRGKYFPKIFIIRLQFVFYTTNC